MRESEIEKPGQAESAQLEAPELGEKGQGKNTTEKQLTETNYPSSE